MMINDPQSPFHPITKTWFENTLGTPTPVQAEAWPNIAAGRNTLVCAPTGTGKTLSAFLVFIDRLKTMARDGTLEKKLYVIYISPLKALAGDIRENLHKPLRGIFQEEMRQGISTIENPHGLNIAIRTGDTPTKERRQMTKNPPHILITTPESLYLLLSSMSGRGILKTAHTIIIDELHAMLDSKRGAHLTLSLARLDRLCEKPLQRIGLTATVKPVELAAEYLTGGEPVSIAAPKMQKAYEINVIDPSDDMNVLPEGTIWPELARHIYDQCLEVRSVVAFVEGRMYAEKLAFYVNEIAGAGFARTHHGCVSKEQRHQAENDLRSGKLRLLCATSSMELGIDVGEIDRVVQVSYPRSISSVMQRLGRAGHNPGRVSVMSMFSRMTSENLYCGLTAKVAMDGGIERSRPPRLCFDVLAQHLVSMAAVEAYEIDDVMEILKRAYPFRTVTKEDIHAILEMLAGDYEHGRDLPVRPRLLYDRINGRVEGDTYSRMLAVSTGGTIPDTGMYAVKTEGGIKLGELDEEYVFEARVGDKFLLGSFAWKIRSIDRDKVVVSQTSPEGAQPPFWRVAWLNRKYQTALAFGKILSRINESDNYDHIYNILQECRLNASAAHNTTLFIQRQMNISGVLPDHKTIIVEHFSDEAGDFQIMVHSLFGRRVNAPLAILLQEAAKRTSYTDVTCFEDDDGVLLMSSSAPFPEGLLRGISPDDAEARLAAILPATPLFGMTFRYNANRALMMGVRKAKRQPLWVQRLRGAEMLDMVVMHDNHPLIRETKRECMEDYWDLDAVREVLRGIRSGSIQVREIHVSEPSPMSLQLRRAAEGSLLYEYHPSTTRISRAANDALQEVLDLQAQIKPANEALARAAERRRLPQDANSLHSLLMMEGDLIAGELDVPPDLMIEWLEELAAANRVLYIEPGLWIAAEHKTEYDTGGEPSGLSALMRIVRKALRFRGPMDSFSLADRYSLTVEAAAAILDELRESGEARLDGGLFYHTDVYERARNETIQARRRQAKTQPAASYAALLIEKAFQTAPPAEQLRNALKMLKDREFPVEAWEQYILPLRVNSYRPLTLDTLLAEGGFYWKFYSDKSKSLCFHSYDEIDWEADLSLNTDELSRDAQIIYKLLMSRGAVFSSALTSPLEGRPALDALLELMTRGLIHADSYTPVRQWLDRAKTEKLTTRQKVNARVQTLTSGRWDISRPIKTPPLKESILQAFDKCKILCRETANELNLPWTACLEILRVLEYTGVVRRGYFAEGLSGAQYIRADEYTHIVAALEAPAPEIRWLPAQDPNQPWGRIIKHLPGREFMLIQGNTVALLAGLPIAVFERSGAALRVFDEGFEHIETVLSKFAADYTARRCYSNEKRITVKNYPSGMESAFVKAGFSRVMDDFVLRQGFS